MNPPTFPFHKLTSEIERQLTITGGDRIVNSIDHHRVCSILPIMMMSKTSCILILCINFTLEYATAPHSLFRRMSVYRSEANHELLYILFININKCAKCSFHVNPMIESMRIPPQTLTCSHLWSLLLVSLSIHNLCASSSG